MAQNEGFIISWLFQRCPKIVITAIGYQITESLRLEKTSKIKSNRHPNTTMPAKPCPQVPHLHGF